MKHINKFKCFKPILILFVYFILRNSNKNNEQFLKKKTLNRICQDQEAKIVINAGAFDTDAVPYIR